MKKEKMICDCDNCNEKVVVNKHHNYSNHGGGNAIYGLGVVGALFYFLNGTTTFVAVIIGIGKAVFWPAILMFKLLTFLQI